MSTLEVKNGTTNMSALVTGLAIPDSLLAKEATEILHEFSTELLINHSIRVYLFAAEQGRQQKLRFDAELLYIAAAFHDLGLTKKFSSQNERFEVDAQMPPVSSSPRTTFLKITFKLSGKPSPSTPHLASRTTCAPK